MRPLMRCSTSSHSSTLRGGGLTTCLSLVLLISVSNSSRALAGIILWGAGESIAHIGDVGAVADAPLSKAGFK